MEKILREVLQADKTLLGRRDELIAILEKKVPGNLSRDFASIKKALSLNVGEKFFVGNEDKESVKSEVAGILKGAGMQEARINFVIETFTKALDWDKPQPPPEEFAPLVEEKVDEQKNSESPSVTEISQKAKEQAEVNKPISLAKPQPTPPPPQTSQPSQSQTNSQSPQPSPIIPPPPPQSQTNSQPPADNKKIFIGIAVVALLLFFFAGGNKNDNSNSNLAPQTQQVQENSPQPPPITQNAPPPEDTSYLNAKTELSLNGMDLGISVGDVKKVLGNPNKVENRDGYERYFYDTIEVAFDKNGKLDGIVTDDPKYKTLRGLRVGSNYSEVVDKYGTNSKDMDQGDLMLREYPFTSMDGKPGLLRFAVKKSNNIVSYISVRVVEEEQPKPNTNSNPKIDENERQAALAFLSYHDAITHKDYRAAFNLFTEERKENMNYNVNAFAKGYSNTITSEITDLSLVSKSANQVVMNYTLDARDRTDSNRTLYQQFRGQVEMVKVNGEWKIASTTSKKIKEVMER